jgi:hypothetical protein
MLLTYEQQMNLVNRGLATMKNDGKYTTFKYHRRAMYDYLWHKIPELLECRGHVYDNATHVLVQAAPRKSFNYLERNYWNEVPLDTPVEMYKKINGFMACATIHNSELVVSTTGTTTSEYAKWAKEQLLSTYRNYDMLLDDKTTTLFEVVVPQDPHIVNERQGLHLLGVREKDTGDFYPLSVPIKCTLEQALEITKHDRGEGFMVYPMLADKGNPFGYHNYNHCCKLKTPYYVGKKKLMRMTAKNVEIMYNDLPLAISTLPEMWHEIPEQIVQSVHKDTWLAMNDQQRRVILEDLNGV